MPTLRYPIAQTLPRVPARAIARFPAREQPRLRRPAVSCVAVLGLFAGKCGALPIGAGLCGSGQTFTDHTCVSVDAGSGVARE